MRKLSILNKFAFFLNIILTLVTLVGYLLPYVAPKKFPVLSVLSLGLPFLLLLNLLFLLYWGLQGKRQIILPTLVFIIGLPFFNLFYKINYSNKQKQPDDVVIMSYNVHLFNKFEWMPNVEVTDDVAAFVKINKVDIVCLQEFTPNAKFRLPGFNYKHIITKGKNIQSGLAIYSKYPIVNRGNLNFENSNNNAIYVDINLKGTIVRVYTMHLESIRIGNDINTTPNEIDETKSRKIFNKLKTAFTDQQSQAEAIKEHRKDLKIPVIVAGDMNNSAFSYVYRTIRGELNDSFVEAGKGFGKSYDFDLYPARIDYIFTDKRFQVNQFSTFQDFRKSDHFPIITHFTISKEE